ncbi:MAG: hypothetical protein ABW321_10320 [Polyangiales bacterium]
MMHRLRFFSTYERSRARQSAARRAAGGLLLLAALALGASGALSGCELLQSTCSEDDRDCLGGGYLRSGKTCVRTGDCATGLECIDNTCRYVGSTKVGQECVVSAECAPNLFCSPLDVQCRPTTAAKSAGESCTSSSECERGLVCDADVAELFEKGPFGIVEELCRDAIESDDTPAECTLPRRCMRRGTTDFGLPCTDSAACLPGLYCIPDYLSRTQNICYGGIKLPIEPVSFPLWIGTNCPTDASGPVAYFDVPRESGEELDFYRLPFPNDIRREGDHIDVSAHPRPPATLAPQIAQRFVEANQSLDGFSTNPVVYFRFSRAPRERDLSLDTVRIVNITKGSPEYGRKESIAWGPSEVRSAFICPNWLGLYRPSGAPLRPNTTYAALVTKGLRTDIDDDLDEDTPTVTTEYERSPDFDAMLLGTRPSDPTTAKAWESYQPLRDYLYGGSSDIEASALLNAAVFTTQNATGIVPAMRTAIEDDGAPQLQDMTVCGEDVRSPCLDDKGRGACHAEDERFIEIHGHVRLPMFQRGRPPYEKPDDGGDIAFENGKATVIDHASVCFALSIPKQPAPEGGFPLLLVAHPNGGSFSDQMNTGGLAEWAASLPVPSALLAIDMPVHGSRRGASKRTPQDMYFNLMNPKSARGNVLQGAADLMSLTLLAAGPIDADISPTSQEIRFDASRVALYGHSQGAAHSALMIGSEPRIRSAVLAGLGGHTSISLLEQEKPADMSLILPFLLFDPGGNARLAGGDANPMLALLQSYMDAADPLNYARELYREVPASSPDGHDVFMVYGLYDSFISETSQKAYANAGGLVAVARDQTESFEELPSPVVGNVAPGALPRSVGLKTYDPRADALDSRIPQDGHFVAVSTLAGQTDVRRFLAQALLGETPAIGPDPNAGEDDPELPELPELPGEP